jgi:beta-glucanase (GH16 family)
MFGLFCIIHYFIFSQTPANDTHWQLKWEDNFNSFDKSKWIKMNHGIHGGEPQLYLESQVWTSNGNLVLSLNNTAVICNPAVYTETGACGVCSSRKQYNYRSGWVETTEAYNTHYGYIEARIKFPYKRIKKWTGKEWGLFPAFWTYLDNSGASNNLNSAEIDICEIFGDKHPDNYYNMGVVRKYKESPPDYQQDGWGMARDFPNFSYTDWHTYAVEWDRNRIIWYLDGEVVNSISNHKIVDPDRIILNLAVKGDESISPNSAFQEYMYVDYVKVHTLKCDKNTIVNDIPSFTHYNYAVKKYITLSSLTTIPPNRNICLRANDFIELRPGFYVPEGTVLYLDVSPCEKVNVRVSESRPDVFIERTTIDCYISENVSTARFLVYDETGIVVKDSTITERGTISIQLYARELPFAGTYTYLITADGENSDVMQMNVTDVKNMTVYQNYPNPFADRTTIECYIPQTFENVNLQVYNVCGSLIKDIDVLERETVSIEINADELSSTGIYTYLLIGDGQIIESKQMILSVVEK